MLNRTLALALGAGLVVLGSFGVAAKNLPPLKSVSVDLPDNDQGFPAGPGSDVADNNCRGCHSIEMVMFQPALSHAGWEAEVNKMRNVYKAPIDPKDIGPIVDYLTHIKGAP